MTNIFFVIGASFSNVCEEYEKIEKYSSGIEIKKTRFYLETNRELKELEQLDFQNWHEKNAG